jgi:AsmA protein
VAALLLLVLVALVLTPPLLNVNRLRRRIASSMSQSLGRPVHLDNVTLHVLPMPGFTLENLVVSEDPAFGYEPVIRANTVQATLRASSLWRRHVEFSTIRFIDPSVNLVRNAEGHWNLEQILVQAAHANTAPTAQAKPGPAPRFPYIEATGARVNLKLGEEKMPFSLTEADFALWLPSPQQWHVRLQGKPMRTDTNASDTGSMVLEGTLERAAQMAAVPVDLHASWSGAPLGEATILVTGKDAGWRGSTTVTAALSGPLGAASLHVSLHLNDLRRAEFIPTKPLDVAVECSSLADVTSAVLHQPHCDLPAANLVASAIALDLTGLHPAGLSVVTDKVPMAYLLDWARLLAADVPRDPEPQGDLSARFDYAAPPDAASAGWSGQAQGSITGALPWDAPQTTFTGHPFSMIVTPGQITLGAVNLMPPAKPPLTLTGSATRNGYTLHLLGLATAAEVKQLDSLMPPLSEGLETAVMAPSTGEGTVPQRIDVTCSRVWSAAQTCVAAETSSRAKLHTAQNRDAR